MTYIISNIKKLLLTLIVSSLTLSMAYAGTGATINRGETGSISWTVASAGASGCLASSNYSSPGDIISNTWNGSNRDGFGSLSFAKVTATAGTYNFDCIVPVGTGSCTGSATGPQGVCWDRAVLIVNACPSYTTWVGGSTNACMPWKCTPGTQTQLVCTQVANGTRTSTCDPDGLGASPSCTLVCTAPFTVSGSGNSCVCPAGQNEIAGTCMAPMGTINNPNCDIYNTQSSCTVTLIWNVTGATAVTLKNSAGTVVASDLPISGSRDVTGITRGGASFKIYDKGTGRYIDTANVTAQCSSLNNFNPISGLCETAVCTPNAIDITTGCVQPAIGTATHDCNGTGTGYINACRVTDCPSTHILTGGTCVLAPCSNGCSNNPACNSASGRNYFSTPGPKGVCKDPTGSITSAPDCVIAYTESTCSTTIRYNTTDTINVRLETCAGTVVSTTAGSSTKSKVVTLNRGLTQCYKIVDVTTGIDLDTKNINADCDTSVDTWDAGSGTCRHNVCSNGCTNSPNCNSAANKNYSATPAPDGACVSPSASFTATPSCGIDTNNSSCLTTLSWTISSGNFRFEDCSNLTGDAGAYLPNVSAGAGSGQVTVPYDKGCYRLVDKGTGYVVSVHALSGCKGSDEWSAVDNKCLAKLSISSTPSTRYFGDPYTFNWTTNANSVSVSQAGNVIANNVSASANGYNISGVGLEPSLTDNSATLIFNLIASKLGMTSATKNATVSLLYRARAAIGSPTVTGGIVKVPFSCDYSTSYDLKNTNTGVGLKSDSGLDKSTITNSVYACPLLTCHADLSLLCRSDSNDTAIATLDLNALKAKVLSFSVTPSSVEKNSVNNKISLGWNVSNTDSCYISVSSESLNGAVIDPKDIVETALLNAKIRASSALYPLTSAKSSGVSLGANVITGVSINYAKVFTLTCGDSDHDGIPDGRYVGDASAIKRAKLNISQTKEQ